MNGCYLLEAWEQAQAPWELGESRSGVGGAVVGLWPWEVSE